MPVLIQSSPPPAPDWAKASDRQVMAGVRRADEQAFRELMRRKTAPLMRVAARVVGNREDARDVVQLVFLRAWERRRRFDPRWSPNTWLYRIAVNLSIDLLRARQARTRARRPLEVHLRAIRGGRSRSLADLERSEVETIFRRLATELPERQRLVFMLAGVEGLSSQEVGEILGCRASTVRNQLAAARRKLRCELTRLYPEYAPRRGPDPAARR